MINPKLQALIQAVVDSADDDGCSDDLTVASKSAIAALAAHDESSAYVDSEGLNCPNCGSTDGVAWTDNLECDGTIVWNWVSCTECGAGWSERYDLTDAVGIVIPKDKEVSDG
jgi:DNA-directed RNA polymerase subunit M/transcription elongation factor TFIIS